MIQIYQNAAIVLYDPILDTEGAPAAGHSVWAAEVGGVAVASPAARSRLASCGCTRMDTHVVSSRRDLLKEGRATVPCLAERLTTELIEHICVSARRAVCSPGRFLPTHGGAVVTARMPAHRQFLRGSVQPPAPAQWVGDAVWNPPCLGGLGSCGGACQTPHIKWGADRLGPLG